MLSLTPRRFFLLALLGALPLGGCGGGSTDASETPREVIYLPPPLEIDTDLDQKEVRRPPQLSGQLPAEFPGDLPLYLPASLTDFGTDEGGRWVEILTSHGAQRVRPELERKITEAGWRSAGGGAYEQGGRRVRVVFQGESLGTVIRIYY
ncbi:MAG: hypothetical protein AAF725_07100 [Acidobacteriota bacterium]